MLNIIVWTLIIPIITASLIFLLKKPAIVSRVNLAGSAATSLLLFWIVKVIVFQGTFQYGIFLIDSLNALFLLIVGAVAFTSALFSLYYMERELKLGHLTAQMLTQYCILFQFFLLTMILTLLLENIGMLWVALEAATLVAALLVASYSNRSSLEAAWKYMMICSVGIAMALLGNMLLYYAQVQAVSVDLQPLSWVALRRDAVNFDPALTRLAIIFIIIGYGTKAGIAPMHTWLPDAHSQAPMPVSALFSGALLSCAVYAIARNMAIINLIPEAGAVAGKLLTGFGIFSIAVAVPLLMLQHDIKRLLAYSSVENIGLVVLGMGMGTPLGMYGALLHILNHAVGKSALFYMAGILTQQYRTKQIFRIRGVMTLAPFTGVLFMALVMAISGMPPFGIFLSKFLLVQAVFASSGLWVGMLVLLLLAGVLIGLVYYLLRMVLGSSPPGMEKKQTGLGILSAGFISMLLLAATGLYVPEWLDLLLRRATEIVVVGGRQL